jgi:succinate dehydrogenase/fumarate reductase flavoprotein subunit
MRNGEKLASFLSDVRQTKEVIVPRLSVTSPREMIEALELYNLLLLAELEARVCLERTESRGPHYREDFPHQDDKNWLKSIIVKKMGDSPELEAVVLDPQWRDKGDDKIGYWG